MQNTSAIAALHREHTSEIVIERFDVKGEAAQMCQVWYVCTYARKDKNI